MRRLLAGQAVESEEAVYTTAGRWGLAVAMILLAAAIGLAFAAMRLGGEAQAGAFVGSGTLVLVALLVGHPPLFQDRRTDRMPAGPAGACAGWPLATSHGIPAAAR